MGDDPPQAQTQPAGAYGRTHGGTQFVPLTERHPAHAATWNQVGRVCVYIAPYTHTPTVDAILGLPLLSMLRRVCEVVCQPSQQ